MSKENIDGHLKALATVRNDLDNMIRATQPAFRKIAQPQPGQPEVEQLEETRSEVIDKLARARVAVQDAMTAVRECRPL